MPTAAPIAMSELIGAKIGAWCPSMRCEMNQASIAAMAACSSGRALARRRVAERRIRALVLAAAVVGDMPATLAHAPPRFARRRASLDCGASAASITYVRTRSDTFATAPLAWSRAAAFGIVSGGMGVLGHDLVARSATDPRMLLAGVAFAALVARPLAPLRIGARSMLFGIAVLQTVVHLACIALMDAAPGMGAAGHAHAHMASPAAHVVAGGWQMLLVHAVSLVLGAAVLLTLEQHAWSGVRTVVRAVVDVLVGHAVVRRTRRAVPDLRFPVRPAPPRSCSSRDAAGWLGMRGPPLRAIASIGQT